MTTTKSKIVQPDLPPLPHTEWVLRMPPRKYEDGWNSHQDGYTDEQMRDYAQAYGDARAAAAVLAEREACARAAGEYAKKWWNRHSVV